MTLVSKPRTNADVQAILAQAIELVAKEPQPKEEFARLQLLTLHHSLQLGRAYCASGNSIPGLGGRGLEELLKLALELIEGSYDYQHRRLNFKHLALAF